MTEGNKADLSKPIQSELTQRQIGVVELLNQGRPEIFANAGNLITRGIQTKEDFRSYHFDMFLNSSRREMGDRYDQPIWYRSQEHTLDPSVMELHPPYLLLQKVLDKEKAVAAKRWQYLNGIRQGKTFQELHREIERVNTFSLDNEMLDTRGAYIEIHAPRELTAANVGDYIGSFKKAIEEAAVKIEQGIFDGIITIDLVSNPGEVEIPTFSKMFKEAGGRKGWKRDDRMDGLLEKFRAIVGSNIAVVVKDEAIEPSEDNPLSILAAVNSEEYFRENGGRFVVISTEEAEIKYGVGYASVVWNNNAVSIGDGHLALTQTQKETGIVDSRLDKLFSSLISAIEVAQKNQHGVAVLTTPEDYGKTTFIDALKKYIKDHPEAKNTLRVLSGFQLRSQFNDGFGNLTKNGSRVEVENRLRGRRDFDDEGPDVEQPLAVAFDFSQYAANSIKEGETDFGCMIVDELPVFDPTDTTNLMHCIGLLRGGYLGHKTKNLIIFMQPHRTPVPKAFQDKEVEYVVKIDPETKSLR